MGPNFRKNFFFVKQNALFLRAGNFEPDFFSAEITFCTHSIHGKISSAFNLHVLRVGEINSLYIRFPVRNLHNVESGLVGFPKILRVDASGIISRERSHLLGLVDMTKRIVISSD